MQVKTTRGYNTILTIPNLKEYSKSEAISIFQAYKHKNVIKNKYFEDDVWNLNDEKRNYSLKFIITDEEFALYSRILKLSKEEFTEYLKEYITLMLGELSVFSLQNIVNNVKKTINTPVEELEELAKKETLNGYNRVIQFFTLLPSDGRNRAMQKLYSTMENVISIIRSKPSSNQRELAYFDSYFIFTELLERFWSEAEDDEKVFYFPIWMWWKVSNIIPVRPTELVVTRRDCLQEYEDGWYITLRKTALKGRNKSTSYNIEEDYKLARYGIDRDTANEINWYIEKTKEFGSNELKTLFVADIHYEKWNRCKPYYSRYYTYTNLNTCLRYFYENIIKEKYGYKIVFERENTKLRENEINYLSLGDSRHLSMINAIINGLTPVMAMLLAGHDSIDMASHYFSNIAKMIECKVYRQYKRTLLKDGKYSISRRSGFYNFKDPIILPDGGFCYSEKVKVNDFSDCYKVCNSAAEIGVCTNCDFYRAAGNSFKDRKEEYVHQIEVECNALLKIVNMIRKDKGEKEDLMQQIMKLNSAEYSYQRFIEEILENEIREECKNG